MSKGRSKHPRGAVGDRFWQANSRVTYSSKDMMAYLNQDQFLMQAVERFFAKWDGIYEAVDLAVLKWRLKPQVGDSKPGIGAASFRPRDHFRKDGSPKKIMTKEQAQAVANQLNLNPYECWVCQAWHVGHKIGAVA